MNKTNEIIEKSKYYLTPEEFENTKNEIYEMWFLPKYTEFKDLITMFPELNRDNLSIKELLQIDETEQNIRWKENLKSVSEEKNIKKNNLISLLENKEVIRNRNKLKSMEIAMEMAKLYENYKKSKKERDSVLTTIHLITNNKNLIAEEEKTSKPSVRISAVIEYMHNIIYYIFDENNKESLRESISSLLGSNTENYSNIIKDFLEKINKIEENYTKIYNELYITSNEKLRNFYMYSKEEAKLTYLIDINDKPIFKNNYSYLETTYRTFKDLISDNKKEIAEKVYKNLQKEVAKLCDGKDLRTIESEREGLTILSKSIRKVEQLRNTLQGWHIIFPIEEIEKDQSISTDPTAESNNLIKSINYPNY